MALESSEQLAERLKAEGSWTAFCDRRAELESEGWSKKDAYGKAVSEFSGENTTADLPIPMTDVNGRGFPIPAGVSKPIAATSDMFAGKTATISQVIQWVFESMELADVKPDAAPSAGAWGLLMHCRKNPDAKQDFYLSVWPKLLPAKSQLDVGHGFSDDGRALELIDRVARISQESVLRAGTKGLSGKPGVSQTTTA